MYRRERDGGKNCQKMYHTRWVDNKHGKIISQCNSQIGVGDRRKGVANDLVSSVLQVMVQINIFAIEKKNLKQMEKKLILLFISETETELPPPGFVDNCLY